MVAGQAPDTLELRNSLGKNTNQTKVVHAYITADAIHTSTRNIYKVKSGVSLRCVRSILVHTSHYSRLEKPTIPLATQERLPRIYCTQHLRITPHMHVRPKSIEKKKENNRKEEKEEEIPFTREYSSSSSIRGRSRTVCTLRNQ